MFSSLLPSDFLVPSGSSLLSFTAHPQQLPTLSCPRKSKLQLAGLHFSEGSALAQPVPRPCPRPESPAEGLLLLPNRSAKEQQNWSALTEMHSMKCVCTYTHTHVHTEYINIYKWDTIYISREMCVFNRVNGRQWNDRIYCLSRNGT